jgi:hypothetical protein
VDVLSPSAGVDGQPEYSVYVVWQALLTYWRYFLAGAWDRLVCLQLPPHLRPGQRWELGLYGINRWGTTCIIGYTPAYGLLVEQAGLVWWPLSLLMKCSREAGPRLVTRPLVRKALPHSSD